MPIGLRDYVIQADDDLDFFRKAKIAGFHGVEPGPTREQLQDPCNLRLLRLREAMKETGLAIPCLSLNRHNQGGLGSSDAATREAAMEDVRCCFRWASFLGSRLFLLPFFGKGSLKDDGSRELALRSLTELCSEALPLGITLAYEGDLPAEQILGMAERIDSSAFGCYFDLANPLVAGRDPVQELRVLKDLVRSVHIKDFREHLGDCRPGQGCVPLKECAKTLREIRYEGWLVLETPPASVDVVSGDWAYVQEVFGS